jgi:hypothetical protein
MKSLSRIVFRSASLAFKSMPIFKMTQAPMFSPFNMNLKYTFSHRKIQKSSYEGQGFYVEQLPIGCLAIYSYYIESNG